MFTGARFFLSHKKTKTSNPRAGQKFYQEQAAGVAMDRVEIASVTEMLTVPAGKFMKVVHSDETTPLESGKAQKWYVSGTPLLAGMR